MWDSIKLFFFKNKIQKDLASNKSIRQMINLNDAKKIGIVFDATNYNDINVIHDFKNTLRNAGKEVEIFGFIKSNEKKEESFLITDKDLNWYGYPIKEQVFLFSNLKLDIVFGIYNDENSPLNAIFANTQSRLRIGAFENHPIELFDVMVGIKKDLNTKNVIKALSDFLIQVKTK
jgi:hypothetical protein